MRSVFLLLSFSGHPFPNVARPVNNFDPLSGTGNQKPNCVDVHETQFIQIQNHLSTATLDFSAQVIEMLISKFTAKPDSSTASHRRAFHPQRHLRSSIRGVRNAK